MRRSDFSWRTRRSRRQRKRKRKNLKPKAKKEPKPLPKLSRREEAKAIWNGAMVMLSKSSVRDAIPLLGEKETRVCYEGLRDLAALLKKHLEEF